MLAIMGQKLSVGFKTVLCATPSVSSDSSTSSADIIRCPADDQRASSPCRKCMTPHFTDDSDRPVRLDTLLTSRSLPDRRTRLRHAWNTSDHSQNLSVVEENPDKESAGSGGGFTVHRHPVAQSTDAVRGRVGHCRGLHVYEIHWPRRLRGTHASVGVGTSLAPLRCGGYWSLVGADSQSWGWDIARNRLVHGGPLGLSAARGTCIAGSPLGGSPSRRGNNNSSGSSVRHRGASTPQETGERVYPSARRSPFQTSGFSPVFDATSYVVADSFLLVLDVDEGTLGFAETNGRYLGTAFRGLNAKGRSRKPLYPMISAVWGHAEITINYLGGLDPQPLSLSELSRRTIRRQMTSSNRQPDLRSLPLPVILQEYIADR